MKNEKGITLIALIITIVVLLILAVVAIKAVTGDGIISYAQNASTGYNQAQKEESDMLQTYLNVMGNEIKRVENPETLITFAIDDGSNTPYYQAKEGMTWQEWCDSKYNTENKWEYLEEGGYIVKKGGTIEAGFIFIGNIDYVKVTGKDKIQSGYSYQTGIEGGSVELGD